MTSEGFKPDKDHVIIEVGPGVLPALSTAHKEFVNEFKKNKRILYFGIAPPNDFNEEALYASVAIVLGDDEEGQEALQRVVFIEGDATSIPAKSGTASEIFFRNFLGSNEISESVNIRALEEAWRVLQPGDVLTLTDDNTPHDAKKSEAYAYAVEHFGTPEVIDGAHIDSKLASLSPIMQLPRFRSVFAEQFNQPGTFVARFKKQV